MKIKDCHFTKENIMIAVSDGEVFLANKDEKIMYQVSIVKIAKPLPFKETKKIKIKKYEKELQK